METLDFCGQRPPQFGNNIFEVTETHIRGWRPPFFFLGKLKASFPFCLFALAVGGKSPAPKPLVTIVPISVGTCDLESLVASGHKKIRQPPAANMGFCDFKDIVAFGNNQLWRPLAAKVQGLHSWLSQKMVSVGMIEICNITSLSSILKQWKVDLICFVK